MSNIIVMGDEVYDKYLGLLAIPQFRTMSGSMVAFIDRHLMPRPDGTHGLLLPLFLDPGDYDAFIKSMIRVMDMEQRYMANGLLHCLPGSDDPDCIMKISLCHAGMMVPLDDFMMQQPSVEQYIMDARQLYSYTSYESMDAVADIAAAMHTWENDALFSSINIPKSYDTHYNAYSIRMIHIMEQNHDVIPPEKQCDDIINRLMVSGAHIVKTIKNVLVCMVTDVFRPYYQSISPEDSIAVLYMIQALHDNALMVPGADGEFMGCRIEPGDIMHAFDDMRNINIDFGYQKLRAALALQDYDVVLP